ncbi:E2F-associated phosphoprotein [Octopus bimaculoides]|uniref:E2F-associated phosphoprotein n=1 Tax=Octopus bimaculoides TaxID=37653 RepID=A0A0L8FVY7_OCTBM|nr:E2F-associated phosphoprotein [Octopus bimaculoides]|eukprot:XP_014786392.1 PREDICTED: E2F-associated phosphoprotein-like [Octopus bimaculoides]
MFNCTDDEDYLDLDFDDNSEGNSSESSDDDISIVVRQADNRCKRTTFSKVKPKSILEQDSSDFEDEMEYELSQNLESLKRNLSSSEPQRHLHAAGSEPTTSVTTSVASTSGDGNDGGENNKFYNDIYFDSDEEDTSTENKSKKKKHHRVMSNDELFYDPTMDAKDQLWMDERRRNPHKKFVKFMPPPGSKTKTTKTDRPKLTPKTKAGAGKKSVRFNLADGTEKPTKHKSSKTPKRPTSDALLDCPACMTTICVDCQRHERYPNQYRAMFVMNCSVDYSENLTYPNSNKNSEKMKQSSEKTKEVYHPVYCNECRTQVAVYDKEEIYHFFNVISSYG